MIEKIQRQFALSRQGAKDLIKACFACILSNLVLMIPVGLLYFLVGDLLESSNSVRSSFLYLRLYSLYRTDFCDNVFSIQCYLFGYLCGKRCTSHHPCGKIAQIAAFLFWQKDLADLTSTIMADCTFLETSFSHFIPELIGSIVSTTLVAVGLFFL